MIRRTRAIIAGFASLVAVAVFVAWAIGRFISDRWMWSQWLAWLPTAGIVLGLACVILLRHFVRPRTPGAPPRRAMGITLALAWLTTAGWLAYEWRLWRAVVEPDGAAQHTRLVVFNTGYHNIGAFDKRITPLKPDVFLVASPNILTDMVALRKAIAETTYTVRLGSLVAISRYPITRHGYVPLSIPPARWRPPFWGQLLSESGGEALFVEVQTPDGPLAVWYLDTPSDPWLSRDAMMRHAAGSIASWRGPMLRRRADGLDESTPFEAPPAHIIAGDLNTPRGSHSLSHLGDGMHHAYDEGGWGPMGTFPRSWGLLHIDNVLLSHQLRAVSYDAVDLGAGWHRAVVVDVARTR